MKEKKKSWPVKLKKVKQFPADNRLTCTMLVSYQTQGTHIWVSRDVLWFSSRPQTVRELLWFLSILLRHSLQVTVVWSQQASKSYFTLFWSLRQGPMWWAVPLLLWLWPTVVSSGRVLFSQQHSTPPHTPVCLSSFSSSSTFFSCLSQQKTFRNPCTGDFIDEPYKVVSLKMAAALLHW